MRYLIILTDHDMEFGHEPQRQQRRRSLVLSVENLDEPHLSLERICAVCRDHKLLPVAVRGGTEPVRQSAWALGLGWFAPVDESRAQMLKSVSSEPAAGENAAPVAVINDNVEGEAAAKVEENASAETTRLYRGTVRSGQQVSASGGDLVVIGAVNAGAEVLAAGSIHVYGALRGRALAGIHGNTQAGIYCRELAAELLSVAGNYKRLEDIDSQLLGAPAEVHFTQEQLEIKPLN